jgi:hypothetical protein
VYRIKVFTGSNPSDIEGAANDWLRQHRESSGVNLVQVTSTDVVHISQTSGMQRFTLVIVYQVPES